MPSIYFPPSSLVFLLMILIISGCTPRDSSDTESASDDPHRERSGPQIDQVRFMTLNPGHFHAALVQMKMLESVDNTVHIYAPEGPDLELHINRIEGFNNRADNPTSWQSIIHTGGDYLERMLSEKPGNVVVTAGNNRQKTEYIYRSVESGLNVLSDKPMVIDRDGWDLLVSAFERADQNEVLLYDIMTERSQVTSRLLRVLTQEPEIFGTLRTGSATEPAIELESVHHLFKYVAGEPLRRPPWYFDVEQQGEGIVDVTTHLVDLSMWINFPDEIIDHRRDLEMVSAERWPTRVTREQFGRITGEDAFPSYLQDQLDENGVLPYYCNGRMTYRINDHYTRVNVIWDYQAPEGGDDTHHTTIRGTRSDLMVRQGSGQDFVATLYLRTTDEASHEAAGAALEQIVAGLQTEFPGLAVVDEGREWRFEIPDELRLGHEAHFSLVADRFLHYLREGTLPEWEVPNMITRYFITTQAREMAME